MQIVSNGDNLHEMSNPFLGTNQKHITNLSPAELAQRLVEIKSLFYGYKTLNLIISQLF